MAQYLDRAGKRYGRLVAISSLVQYTSTGRRKIAWKCVCDCGKEIITRADNLGNGETKSCGCYKSDIAKITVECTREAATKHGDAVRGGMNDIYKLYHCMKGRVNSSREKEAKIYKKRGVIVCDEWKNDYLAFKKWAIENGYKKGFVIDRIDNYGNYEPKNCRFVTQKENMRNTRRNRFLTFKGERKTAAEWIELSNINGSVFRSRLLGGWSIDKIFNTPIRHKNRDIV